MSKRKSEEHVVDEEVENIGKRQRLRKRSASEPPLQNQTVEPEKREALKRLFGRSINKQNNHPPSSYAEVFDEVDDDNNFYFFDEYEDPLLSMVPVNMVPEQLGYLMGAQQSLSYLHCYGISVKSPIFVHLRSRLLQGIADIAAA